MASSPSALPWLWIIETLARFKQVDVSVLKEELVKKTPEITGDFGKDAREMVNFRILDTLASERFRSNGKLSSSPVPANKSDPSELCESVVARMLHESTVEAEMSKTEVQDFTARKRASLPKCTLEKLKDAILEGKHPALASIKEKSVFSTSNKSGDRTAVDYADLNEATGLRDTQNVAVGENLTSLNAENLTSLSEEDCQNRNLTPSKRDTSQLESENQALRSHTDTPSFDHGTDAHFQITKNPKHDASLAGPVVGHDHLPAVGEEPVSAVDRLDLDFPDKETNVAPPNRAHGSIGEADSNIEESQRAPFNNMPNDETQSNNFAHEAEHDKNHIPGLECLSDSDDFQDETIDIATRKSDFLSSQCTFTQDISANIGCTELIFCIKCEKSGELLVCSATDCQIVVHQSCLGTDPSFDDHGKFFCPSCSYSRAIIEYREIKIKASFIRKDLAVFFGVEKGQRPKQIADKSCRPQHNQERRDDDLFRNDQKYQNHVTDAILIENRENIGNAHQEEPSTSNGNPAFRVEIAKYSSWSEHNQQRQNNNVNRNDQKHVNDDINTQNRENIGNAQQTEPSTCNSNQPLREEGDFLDNGMVCASKESNREGGNLGPECQPAMVLERQEVEPQPSQGRGGNSSTCRKRANADVATWSEEEEDYGPFSDYIMRPRKTQKQFTYPATPQLRRKKMEWTSEEEEVLKEGVKKFTGDHDKTIQWTTILEFGSAVFQKGRTAVDLKDKWRNICKRCTK